MTEQQWKSLEKTYRLAEAILAALEHFGAALALLCSPAGSVIDVHWSLRFAQLCKTEPADDAA